MMLRREKTGFSSDFQTQKVVYEGFALFDTDKRNVLVASDSVNCDCQGGVLKGGLGCTPYLKEDGTTYRLTSGMKPTEQFLFVTEKNEDGTYTDTLGFLYKTGMCFLYNKTASIFAATLPFSGRMKAFPFMDGEGVPQTVFVGSAGVAVYNKTQGLVQTEITSAMPIGCVLKDRLFCAIEPFTIAYSAPLAPKEFAESVDDSGRVHLPREAGKIVGMAVLNECVYIFYEYGISKLKLAGSAREFQVEAVAYDGGLIFADSIGVCGEKIFFLTRLGLYAFDGKRARRVCENLPIVPLEENQVCKHAESDGYYRLEYLAENGEEKNLVVNGASEEGYMAFYAKNFSHLRGKTVFYYQNTLYTLRENVDLPSGEKREFIVNNLDFGVKGVKTLKKLRFFGEGKITVGIESERRKKQVELSLDNGFADMRVQFRGKRFTLSIGLETGAVLRGAEADLVRLTGETR